MEPKNFGVVGHPIEHSLSPLMHYASFKELGLVHSYEKYDVAPDLMEDFIKEDAVEKNLSGVNVTIPHKQTVMEYVDCLSREAELIGAVNTIKFGDETKGYNTDGRGFVRCLADEGIGVKDKSFLVIGAGGAGRAITFQTILEGGFVVLADADRDRANRLSESVFDKLGAEVRVVESNHKALAESLEDVEILVNATPVGMHPKTDASVISADVIAGDTIVVDIVYNPIETKLIRECRERGLKTISGVGMLVQQGAESERIWLGAEPPVDKMRDAVVKSLSGV